MNTQAPCEHQATPLRDRAARLAQPVHGAHCFLEGIPVCGWPELHPALAATPAELLPWPPVPQRLGGLR
jgi:hypothetical protein